MERGKIERTFNALFLIIVLPQIGLNFWTEGVQKSSIVAESAI